MHINYVMAFVFNLTDNMKKLTKSKKRGLLRKVHFIKKLGGCCSSCGYNKNISALEFHHKDPSKKEFVLSSNNLVQLNYSRLSEEVSKCLLLCSNCHREEHFPHLNYKRLLSLNLNVPIKSTTNKKCSCGRVMDASYKKCSRCYKKERPTIEEFNSTDSLSRKERAELFDVSERTISNWKRKIRMGKY